MLLAVGLSIAVVLGLGLTFALNYANNQLMHSAHQRAESALNMLSSLHSQAMLNRRQVSDGDPAIATLNSAMAQFSKTSHDVDLWVTMSPKVVRYQLSNRASEMELPQDSIDEAAITTGRIQRQVEGSVLRETRPVVLGEGVASDPRCGSCHTRLMGFKQGEVLGTYSVRVRLGSEFAAWRFNLSNQLLFALCLSVLAVWMLMVLLRQAVLQPLQRIAAATGQLADDELSIDIPYTGKPDEIGQIADALESFRAKLAEREALSAENRLNAFLASHDGLTGLPNRRLFAQKVDEAIAEATATGKRVAGLIIDVDRFKHINDRFGHEAGDAVLRAVASSALQVLRDGEGIARFGGDEFAAYKLFSNEAELGEFLIRLEKAISAPVRYHATLIEPVASIGVSVCPDDTTRREQLINNADIAMYRAKADPALRRSRYDPEMDELSRRRDALRDELRGALERGELSLRFQRQNSAQDGTLCGYEALMRWNHPQLGEISPAEFIPLAEETSEIIGLGDWVLGEACALAARIDPGLSIAVNVSAIQITDPGLPQRIHEMLAHAGVSPTRLEIEITETALASNRERALHVLRQIRALGVRIAVDDFGVGYSALETLGLYPISKIKIDRSFIWEFESQVAARSLVSAVVSIGRSLGVHVLAEGIETPSQAALARELGCSEMQGFLYGKPLTRDEVLKDSRLIRAVA